MNASHSGHRHTSVRAHLLLALLSLICALLGGLYILYIGFLQAGPVLDTRRLSFKQSIRILDRKDAPLYQFSSGEERIFLQTDDVPDIVKKAVIAIEDERFLKRRTCVDFRAVVRAFIANTFDDQMQGASTLTQQLTRMLYLSHERTITRKLYEILLSCRLETKLTKAQILTLYINGVSFGNGLNGIESAAQTYFGIPASQMSIAQAAVLVSIPQRPSYFSPYGPHVHSSVSTQTLRAIRRGEITPASLDLAMVTTGLLSANKQGKSGTVRLPGRSDAVIKAMRRLGFIDEDKFKKASQELLTLKFTPFSHPITAPHFSLWVRQEIESLLKSLDAPSRWEAVGITVHTTLHPQLQRLAENVIRDQQDILTKAVAKNIALVAVDRTTRQVVAYVGNNDFFAQETEGQIDMAKSPRQPGSSIKPLIYAAAFERGFTPETIVLDAPLQIGTDVPKNYEGGYRGLITIREALARSRNIPAIRTFLNIGGEDTVLELASRLGMVTPAAYKDEQLRTHPHFTYGWPMAIGSTEVPLLEMINLYATIANHGEYRPIRVLCSVTDGQGKRILPLNIEKPVQAMLRDAADDIDSILRDSGSRPAGFWRDMLTIPGMETGAKTGTSNVCFERDSFDRCTEYGVNNVWTLGYTPDLVVGVWIGNADNTVLDPLSDGLTVAAPLWRAFIEQSSRIYHAQEEWCF